MWLLADPFAVDERKLNPLLLWRQGRVVDCERVVLLAFVEEDTLDDNRLREELRDPEGTGKRAIGVDGVGSQGRISSRAAVPGRGGSVPKRKSQSECLGAELHFRQLSCDLPVRFYIRAYIECFLLIGSLNGTSTNSLSNSGPGSTVNVHAHCLS
jgi:hypothetical protein